MPFHAALVPPNHFSTPATLTPRKQNRPDFFHNISIGNVKVVLESFDRCRTMRLDLGANRRL